MRVATSLLAGAFSYMLESRLFGRLLASWLLASAMTTDARFIASTPYSRAPQRLSAIDATGLALALSSCLRFSRLGSTTFVATFVTRAPFSFWLITGWRYPPIYAEADGL